MVPTAAPSHKLGEILLREKIITEERYRVALEKYDNSEKPLSRILTEMEAITEGVKIGVLQKRCDCKLISLEDITPKGEAVQALSRRYCEKYHVVPLRFENNQLVVAMEDPTDTRTVNAIEALVGKPVIPVLAKSADLASVIERLPSESATPAPIEEHGPLYRFFSLITLPVICAVPILGFIGALVFYRPFQNYWFQEIGFSPFEQVLVFMLGWCAWAVIAYWIDGVLFKRMKDEED